MRQKWLISLIIITFLFVTSSFFIEEQSVFGFKWMTFGMSLVAFIYYYVVTTANAKDSKKMIGGNLAAIVLKFILSGVVIILYIIFFGMENRLDFVSFFIAYSIYSIVNYTFSYHYKNE